LSLLGLDAPIVALVWQDFLSRCYPSMLRPAGRWTLGLTVWAIYLADRLLDVRQPRFCAEPVPHRFCRSYRGFATALLGIVVSADLVVGFRWLRHAVFANGLVVSAGVAAYFGAFPVGRFRAAWKPGMVALLFATGVFVVAWTGIPNPGQALMVPAVAFCLLCFSNLLLIRAWALRTSNRPGLWAVALAVAFAAFAAPWWFAGVALSAAGLGVLAFLGARISHTARRVLADAVLLSPLLCLWTLIG
jgi:hypothetical protein